MINVCVAVKVYNKINDSVLKKKEENCIKSTLTFTF